MCHTSPLSLSKLSCIPLKKDPADLGGMGKVIVIAREWQGRHQKTG
jgi:hypothetical protein